MKNTKILLGVVLVLLVFSFVPAVLGYSTVKRSLDTEWFRETGIFPRNNPTIGWWASEQLIAYPNYDSDWNEIPIWECDAYSGHIIEREMSDGKYMITVTIIVKGAPVIVETFNPANPVTLFKGKMDYIYQQKFIIDLDFWAQFLAENTPYDVDGVNDGYENGHIILPGYFISIFDDYLERMYGLSMGLDFVSVLLVGHGKGEIINSWNGLEPGDIAKINLGALGTAGKGYKLIDYNFFIWPLNHIKLY